MDNTVIIALITLFGVICSGFFSYLASKKQHDATIMVMDEKIKNLERKMDLHNNAVMRLTVLETQFQESQKNK